MGKGQNTGKVSSYPDVELSYDPGRGVFVATLVNLGQWETQSVVLSTVIDGELYPIDDMSYIDDTTYEYELECVPGTTYDATGTFLLGHKDSSQLPC